MRHTTSRVFVVLATIALTACNAATTVSPSPSPPRDTTSPIPTTTPTLVPATPSPTATAPPQATTGALPPDGSWQVELTAAELVAAGWPADITPPGTYTWTFNDSRARLDLEEEDGDTFFCEADMEALDEGFRSDLRRRPLRRRSRRHRLDAGGRQAFNLP